VDEQVVPAESPVQASFRSWLAGRFLSQLERLGWEAAPGEHELTRLRRAARVRQGGGIAEEPGVLAEARRRADLYLADRRALEPNLTDAVVGLAARVGDEALYERYRAAVGMAETPQERRRFLLNLASFRTSGTLRRTLDAVLTPEIPTQDVAFILIRLLGNPFARLDAWRFIQKRWSALRKRVPPLMLSRLVDAMPALREPRHAREVAAFFRRHPLPEAERALRQSLEVFRLNAELRRRTAPGVAEWLERRAP
jgi:puromycin-sensitive aminopeptidase